MANYNLAFEEDEMEDINQENSMFNSLTQEEIDANNKAAEEKFNTKEEEKPEYGGKEFAGDVISAAGSTLTGVGVVGAAMYLFIGAGSLLSMSWIGTVLVLMISGLAVLSIGMYLRNGSLSLGDFA